MCYLKIQDIVEQTNDVYGDIAESMLDKYNQTQ